MIGNNTLILNTATVIEALQEYFDKQYSPKVKVRDFKVYRGGYPSGSQWQVELAEGGEK